MSGAAETKESIDDLGFFLFSLRNTCALYVEIRRVVVDMVITTEYCVGPFHRVVCLASLLLMCRGVRLTDRFPCEITYSSDAMHLVCGMHYVQCDW